MAKSSGSHRRLILGPIVEHSSSEADPKSHPIKDRIDRFQDDHGENKQTVSCLQQPPQEIFEKFAPAIDANDANMVRYLSTR